MGTCATQILPTIHERSKLNPYDHYAIAARKSLSGTLFVESTVGHLRKEISRLTRFIMLQGAVVIVKILDTHHCRSPLVQGGLEMPIQVILVKVQYSPQNKDALLKYDLFIEQHYKEPVHGKFEDIIDTTLKDLEPDTDEQTVKQKTRSKLLILVTSQEQKWIWTNSAVCTSIRGCGSCPIYSKHSTRRVSFGIFVRGGKHDNCRAKRGVRTIVQMFFH